MALYRCEYCDYDNCDPFIAPSSKLLERHIKNVHSQDPGFSIECKHPSCSRVFVNYRTYQNHLLKHNRSPTEPVELAVTNTPQIEVNEEMEISPPVTGSYQHLPSFTDYCAKWILKTSETRKLTRNATLGIVHDVSDIVKEVSLCIEDQVKCCLQENGINFDNVSGLSEIFTESNVVISPFAELMSFHQQLAYFKKHFSFIVSLIL